MSWWHTAPDHKAWLLCRHPGGVTGSGLQRRQILSVQVLRGCEYVPGRTIGACASGRIGISCGECEASTAPAVDGSCADCDRNDTAPFVSALLGLAFMMLVPYCVINRENRSTQPQTLLLVGIVAGMMITFIQQMGVFSTMSIPWAEPTKTMLDIMRFMNLDIDIVRMGCVMTIPAFNRFAIKLSAFWAHSASWY